MNSLTSLMSNSLSVIQSDTDQIRRKARAFQTKETSITFELQQAIMSACEKLQANCNTQNEFVSKVKDNTGINLSDALKHVIEEDQEKVARNYARANQFEITYGDFNESDAATIIDAANYEKTEALNDLLLIFGEDNKQLKRVVNGQTVKHFNPKITELKDIFHIAAVYPDGIMEKCLGSFGRLQCIRHGIESETLVRMKNCRYLISQFSQQAKQAILNTQESKNLTELTPSIVTDAVNILQKTIFKNEGIIEKHRQRISEYRYALRMYEDAKRDTSYLTSEEVIAQLLSELHKVSLSIDLRVLEQSYPVRPDANKNDSLIVQRIIKLFVFRCMLQNVIAVLTKVISSMDEIYEKRRVVLNKVCRSTYKLGTKPDVDAIFDVELYKQLLNVNADLRSMTGNIQLDVDMYDSDEALSFDDHIKVFNKAIVATGLVEPTAYFSVVRDPQSNFDSSTFYEIFNEKTAKVLSETERQLLVATKVERQDREDEHKESSQDNSHWSQKLSSNINDGISVMFDPKVDSPDTED